MKVKDLMSKHVIFCISSETAQVVAKVMKTHNIGAVPVVSDSKSRRLEGIVTDRDLCCAVLAGGKPSSSVQVGEVMTRKPVSCKPEDSLKHCERLMRKRQVRRVPVVNERGGCIGIVAQADIARHAAPDKVGKMVAAISKPARADRRLRAAA